MDTSKQYILMCERAGEIQSLIMSDLDEFLKMLPIFIYDHSMKRVSICIWTPKTMIKEIKGTREEAPYINVSIERNNDGGIREYPTDELYQEGHVWLPRQDQLQEMLTDKFSTREITPCLEKISKFNIHNFGKFKSWEQLWLAFVMKERWNKVWNGTDWEDSK